MIELLAICTTAILSAAIYRLAAIYNIQSKMTTRKGIIIMLLIHIFLPTPVLIMAIFVIKEIWQKDIIFQQIHENYPAIRELLYTQTCAFTSINSPIMKSTIIVCVIYFVIVGKYSLIV